MDKEKLVAERRTVSYTVNQYHPSAGYKPDRYMVDHGVRHMDEIVDKGFDEVIICFTELDMASAARRRLTKDMVAYAKSIGLLVTVDLWRVGGIFGGEGVSFYEQNGGRPCLCDPDLYPLLDSAVGAVSELGFDRMFHDEAGLQCGERVHSDGDDATRSRALIDRLSQLAVNRGITWNSSCVRARAGYADMTGEFASMTAIDEIAVAPYPFHPESTVRKPQLEIIENLAMWFDRAKSAADAHGVTAQAWVQGFNISHDNMAFLDIYFEQIARSKIGNIALWTYNAGADIPDLNPTGSAPTDIVWQKTSQLMQSSRSIALSH